MSEPVGVLGAARAKGGLDWPRARTCTTWPSRAGRTGEHFMKIAKAGNIHQFCHPNSLFTLQE